MPDCHTFCTVNVLKTADPQKHVKRTLGYAHAVSFAHHLRFYVVVARDFPPLYGQGALVALKNHRISNTDVPWIFLFVFLSDVERVVGG